MKIYQKKWEIHIPRPIDEIWDFFARPENLNEMTPKDMQFKILTDISDQDMYEGMIIQYKVSPMLNIQLNWCTEITHIRDREYFIDEQRFGPYSLWHHQHHFKAVKNGVLMTDILHYAIPLGPLGRFANWLFVDKRIQEIFDYREGIVREKFGKLEA